MVFYTIRDTSGRLLDSFSDAQLAHDALVVFAQEDPKSARRYVMLSYDEDGLQVGKAVLGSDVYVAA